ncbi:MAG: SDR family NAD(P)-dependent oxidoreductase [Alphaproteobacteria bacterium]
MLLEGKVALITGAGSGIGRALAVEAARRGIRLALAGCGVAALERTASMLPPGAGWSIISADVTDPYARRLLREHLAGEWGQLDILVNNAGLVLAGPLAATADRDIERVMASNLIAPMALTRELLPLLVATAPSRVVNMGSLFGDIPYPLFATYSAAKFGLRGFSAALRRELRGLGVGVTYATPHATLAETTEAIRAFVGPLGMALERPETTARKLWDAVARGADSVYPMGCERLYVALERCWPKIIDRVVAGQLADGRLRSALLKAMPWVRPTPARHGVGEPAARRSVANC